MITNRSPAVPSTTAPHGQSVSPDDPGEEIEALAALLAEVVERAGHRVVFPGRLAMIAELAQGHESVCRAMMAEGTTS